MSEIDGSEEFVERLVGVLNAGMLALMTSVGHRTGLFDTMASLGPATSERIADAAGLDERYVREWLAAMTTGRFVDHDPGTLTFALPPERAAWLTRAAGPDNLAVQAQYVGLLALVEDQRLLQRRWWCAVRRVPEVPGTDGRRQRRGPRRQPS